MPKNRDYLVGKYSYILSSDQNCDIMTILHFIDFDSLFGENWLCKFVINICLLSYAFKLGLKNTHFIMQFVTQLMRKREISEEHNKTTFTQNGMVIMSWLVNNNSHWIVVFINFKIRPVTSWIKVVHMTQTVEHQNFVSRKY